MEQLIVFMILLLLLLKVIDEKKRELTTHVNNLSTRNYCYKFIISQIVINTIERRNGKLCL